ncbi:hypothetical protein [Ramlibacter sp. AN1133]|uniref:hypothetical protein n=1 Tax=Ramlibacter sp. AN1133 TaxID=3133429 RepID=UPI0030C5C429
MGEALVYVLLAVLPLAAWDVSRRGLFRPGDDVGYWLGVAGGTMMLLLFAYPLRKHLRFARGWGRVKGWFLVHVVLGIGGPLLILLHTTFSVGSLNAGVALFSMIAVALSGVVGRFLYTRVHRERNGRQVSFEALRTRAGLDQHEARSRLAFAPEVEQRLIAFAKAELQARPGLRTWLRQALLLPARQWLVYRRCVRELQAPLDRLARHAGWSEADRRRRDRLARKLVRRYLAAVVSVAGFTACERLFSLWHVAHIPFVYMLVLSAAVHVVAVHAY